MVTDLVIRKVDFLAAQLGERELTISKMHANLDQKARDLVMKEFRSGSSRVLSPQICCAQDRCAAVSLVVNYDLP